MKHNHRFINEVKQRICGMVMDQFNTPGDKLPFWKRVRNPGFLFRLSRHRPLLRERI